MIVKEFNQLKNLNKVHHLSWKNGTSLMINSVSNKVITRNLLEH